MGFTYKKSITASKSAFWHKTGEPGERVWVACRGSQHMPAGMFVHSTFTKPRKEKLGKTGHDSHCIACRREYQRQRQVSSRSRVRTSSAITARVSEQLTGASLGVLPSLRVFVTCPAAECTTYYRPTC